MALDAQPTSARLTCGFVDGVELQQSAVFRADLSLYVATPPIGAQPECSTWLPLHRDVARSLQPNDVIATLFSANAAGLGILVKSEAQFSTGGSQRLDIFDLRLYGYEVTH